MLDDALALLRFGVVPEQRPDPAAIATARSSVRTFLEDALGAASIAPAPEPPPPPSLVPLRAAGIRTVGDEEFRHALAGLDDRRRTLLGLVRGDGWNWAD